MNKPKPFEDGPARGQGIDDQIPGAELGGIARPRGDDRPIEPTAAMLLARAAAIQPAECAFAMGIQPADARRAAVVIRDVSEMLGRAFTNAAG
ncbi:MAG: hypothetical protein HY000_22550 [Planctomycetes bacterium]|nr:hypothetical protein [Planctomycetota bacterium]